MKPHTEEIAIGVNDERCKRFYYIQAMYNSQKRL